MLDLNRLRMLREVQRRGTLAAVAAAMSYSPATISQQLSQLEAQAGVKLLEPIGRGVRLTAEAEMLVARTEELLEILERAETDLAASRDSVTGTIRLAMLQSAAVTLLPSVLTQLEQEAQKLRIEVFHLEPEASLEAIQNRGVDIAVTQEYPADPLSRGPQIEHEALFKDPIQIGVSGRENVQSLEDLARDRWVLEPDGTPAHRWAIARCREAGFEPDVRFHSHDLIVHRRLIETGQAVGFLPRLTYGIESPEIRLISLGRSDAYRSILTSTRRGAGRHPRIIAVRSALARAANEFS